MRSMLIGVTVTALAMTALLGMASRVGVATLLGMTALFGVASLVAMSPLLGSLARLSLHARISGRTPDVDLRDHAPGFATEVRNRGVDLLGKTA